jgi:hypothetical protein
VGITRTIRSRSVPRAVQGQLALQWRLPGELDAVPDPGPLLRRVSAQGGPDPDTDPAVAQVPTAGAALPDPGPWTAQLVQAVIEVLGHERPRQQLVRWLSPEVYADLSAHVLAAAPRGPGQRPRRTVSSIHLSEPADGVIEASAVVLGGRRARALALRLEGWDGRWRCTRLALL